VITTLDRVRVDHEDLRRATIRILEACGLCRSDAVTATDCLVEADLRGVDSHGVSNLLRVYVDGLRTGHVAPRPEVRTIRSRPGTATIDGGRGLGVVVAPRAMDVAIAKARDVGIGMVTVRNSRHLGMAAYHAMRALHRNMIGLCMTAVGPRVVPTFGSEPRLGTNPIAVAVPTRSVAPFVFDAATTTIAMNAIRLAQRDGRDLPGGVIADADGTPIMEAGPVPDDFRMLPLGATRELGSHKGYGLACVVEVLSAVLSGGPLLGELGIGHASHVLVAVDVDAFAPVDEFRASMDGFVDWLTSCPPAPGHDRVLVAGEQEHELQLRRRAEGIPLRAEVVDDLAALAAEVGVEPLHRRADVR
jgi:L-2-hydroxycarboxylate dehydrogenase (NAD+)